jgi:hypothetical protein
LPLNGLLFISFSVLSIAHALLDGTLLPERAELVEVKSDRGKDHLDAHAWHGGLVTSRHGNVRRMKDAFEPRVVPLARRSFFAMRRFRSVSRMLRGDDSEHLVSSHRRGVAVGYCALIAFFYLGTRPRLLWSGQSGCREPLRWSFRVSNEPEVCIHVAVELVAELGFGALLCQRTLLAPPRLRIVSARRIN